MKQIMQRSGQAKDFQISIVEVQSAVTDEGEQSSTTFSVTMCGCGGCRCGGCGGCRCGGCRCGGCRCGGGCGGCSISHR
jgi:hypothetical protein